MEWPIVLNSLPAKVAFFKVVDDLWEQHKYLTFSEPRIGPDRSLTQNNLFHLWATDCWFYYQSLPKGKIQPDELDSIKRSLKKRCYGETGWPWLSHVIVDVFGGPDAEPKKDFKSSADYSRGEMFDFLTWLQMRAAQDGLILESKGEFAKNQRAQSK